MDYYKRFEPVLNRVEKELMGLFEGKDPSSLYEPMVHLLKSGGKRIRPLLLILSCEAVGGSIDACIHAAVAVELLHTFTLVHDDIMDHDDLRRGDATVHAKWDEATAILAGDGLVTLAYQTLLKTSHPDLVAVLKCFTDGLMVLCEGQALDKAFENREDVLLTEYLDMIHKKTATLLEVSCESGALLGRGNPDESAALKRFAKAMGMAFQIQDDLLDLYSDETVSGKSFGSDLVEKKKTYLTCHFLNSAPDDLNRTFTKHWEKSSITREDVLQMRDLFEKAGTRTSAINDVANYLSEALTGLNVLRSNQSVENMRFLVDQLRDRKA